MIKKANTIEGFTIVELLIVVVVIAILAAITLTMYNGIQTRTRNTAMISAVKQYVNLIEMYNASEGTYPNPPNGTSYADQFACFGEFTTPCVHENIDLTAVNSQPWFNNQLKRHTKTLPPVPTFLKWNDDGTNLYAGGAYRFAPDPASPWMNDGGFSQATALVVYYLEGKDPTICGLTSATSKVFENGNNTDRDLVVCYLPIGNFVLRN